MAPAHSPIRVFPTRVHLTTAGWLFLVVTVLVALATVRSQAPLSFLLFGGMLGAVVVSAVASWRMVARVRLDRDIPRRVWQNRTAHMTYRLANRRRRGACLGLQVEECKLRDVDFAPAHCVHLEGGEVFRAAGRFAPRRRGDLHVRHIRLSTSFPFGLLRACRLFRLDADLVVWPARGRLKRQLLRRGAVEASAAAPAPVQGGQDEFFGLREYRDGDNPRWIHWRRSAARIAPVVREMARPRPEVLCVVLDTDRRGVPAGDQRRERALRFAATLIDYAFAQGYKVGLALGGASYAPGAGVGQRATLLDALAFVDADGPPLGRTLAQLSPAVLRDAQVVVVSLDRRRLEASDLRAIRAGSGGATAFCAEDLDAVFEDAAAAAQEGR